jgi:hypothetical protein
MSVYVAPIVEGQTEQHGGVRELIQRIWYAHFDQSEHLDVLRAVRGGRAVLGDPTRGADLAAKIEEAHIGLRDAIDNDPAGGRGVVLLVLDADKECAKALGPALIATAKQHCPHISPFACVLAVREFENWLVAGAAGFRGRTDLDLPDPLVLPADPEGFAGASWLVMQRQQVSRSKTYKKTHDAVRLIHAMDLAEAHRTSRSFQKLCSEVGKLRPPPVPSAPNTPAPGESP